MHAEATKHVLLGRKSLGCPATISRSGRNDLGGEQTWGPEHKGMAAVSKKGSVVKRKQHIESLVTVPLLIIDDLGMRKLSLTAAEELLEIIMRRYERVSTMITSNRPVDDWGKLLGDSAAVTAMLDLLLHHGHVLKCGPRSWRTKTGLPPQ